MASTPSPKPGTGPGSRIPPRWRTSSSRQVWASSGRTPRISEALATSSGSGREQWPSSLACERGNWGAGLDARAAVGGEPDALGDLVGGLEADAPDVGGQAVRLVGDDLDGLLAV